MPGLSSQDIIRVWELGQDKALWYRALLMLAPAFPQLSLTQLAEFSLGQRNAHLFQLRKQLFGAHLQAIIACPTCAEQLEFSLDVEELCAVNPTPQAHYTLEHQPYLIKFRLLTSEDFGRVQPLTDLTPARQALIEACVIEVRQEGEVVEPQTVPVEVIAALGEFVWECDPLAEFHLSLTCAKCDCAWSPLLDIVSFLWTELASQAQILLDEIHLLASTYGWPEQEILTLSPIRRKYYLSRV
jgi:hypothetical protein